MKISVRIATIVLLLACLCVVLVGCDEYKPQSNENDAQRYYNDKYNASASVSESHGLGNYNLFGYSYRGMEYVMSDGTSVVYLDDEGVFRDNRQAAEIEQAAAAFAERSLQAIPGALTSVSIQSVGGEVYYETYKGEGSCWATRYEGDIAAFLSAEKPALSLDMHFSGSDYANGRFSYEMAYDSTAVSGLEDAYLELGNYFDIRSITLAVVDLATFEEGETGLFDEGLVYTVDFNGDSPDAVKAVHFKPVLVRLTDGATISSATPGVTLKEGDVRFEARDDGFWVLHIAGEAAAHEGSMSYYVRNDGGPDITRVDGIDRLTRVCNAGEHVNTTALIDGCVYYLGAATDIKPRIEIENLTSNRMVVRYHTYFKDQIKNPTLKVIGLARKNDSSTYESTSFDARIVEETSDGWRCTVSIPSGAKSDNKLYFQFTYEGDKDISVQIEQDISLPA